MKKLILIAAMLIAGETHAEVSVELAQAKKVDLSAEMLQNILANGPALGITQKGMRDIPGTLGAMLANYHGLVTDALTRGMTCEQINGTTKQSLGRTTKEYQGTDGAAAFNLSVIEWVAADCVETRARLEAAQ